jgi:thiamine biosynthesis lipoprotein
MHMGTVIDVTIVCRDEKEAEGHFGAAFGEMARIDELLGSHEQKGEVHAVNTGAYPDGVGVSAEVFSLVKRARDIGAASGGAFDVTVGPLMKIWPFEQGGPPPEPGLILETLGAVGWGKLVLDEPGSRIIFRRPGMSLDLGGIGEGYAVDRAVEILAARGVAAGIVNAGGDLRVWGLKPPGKEPWKIGIQHPRRPDRFLGVLTMTGRAVVTSGDYEKNFTWGGRRYAHILDPATGRPAEGMQSVTVVADRAETADAWATALIVLGPEKAWALLERRPDLQAITVGAGGEVRVSPGLADVFRREE